MKRKHIILVMLLVVSGAFTMQSCQKEVVPPITVKNTFTIPVASAPLNGGTVAPTTTTHLTWASTGGAEVKWDVYFGETENPAVLQKNFNLQTIAVPVVEGHTYYWYVQNHDAQGIVTTSPVFSFTVAVSPIIYNIDNFVGTYSVMEGSYGPYIVHLTKINATTLENDNFWDNAPSPLWKVQYVFDSYGNVTIVTPNTYRTSPTSSTIYSVSGSGTYNNTNFSLSVNYTVLKNVYTLQNDGTYKVVKTTADAATDEFTKQ